MRKPLTTLLCYFCLIQGFGQSQRKVSTYLSIQYNHTRDDYTKSANPGGIGLGLQTFFNNRGKFKPTLELTADGYPGGTKELSFTPDGKIANDVVSMVNLFGGASFHLSKNMYLSFIAGPSFIGGETLFGIKPSLGFYFSETKRWTGKISYINIYNRTKSVDQDFGSLSFAFGVRLF